MFTSLTISAKNSTSKLKKKEEWNIEKKFGKNIRKLFKLMPKNSMSYLSKNKFIDILN